YSDAECDIVVIGHGSSDKNARTAFDHTIKSLIPCYRNVHSCFLELDKPNIEEGIKKSLKHNPKILLLAPYFLHEGAHIKYDIENRSFQIIDAEVRSHDYNEMEWAIVRRVIHATADFDFAREARILFRNDPINSAFKAIQDGCTVITDVDMVLSGINKKSAAA